MRRKAFADSRYWIKPVPDFGSFPASLLIVGLAPAAHGANRTGRMFTGDDSGKWLYRALNKADFAETSGFESKDDNKLKDTVITAVAHCAPPDNKPDKGEIENCRPYLERTFLSSDARVVVALGQIAWKSALESMEADAVWGCEIPKPRPAFSHLAHITFIDKNGRRRHLIGSYHPSRQNTNTGRLTEAMLDSVFNKVRKVLKNDT
ncbi:MAG: uracil-DNA glycosylase [Bdellovibrionales bacterium]|nr:uracil-DNA glycosylase [Bdellovibrionales bacterium]